MEMEGVGFKDIGFCRPFMVKLYTVSFVCTGVNWILTVFDVTVHVSVLDPLAQVILLGTVTADGNTNEAIPVD